MAQARPDPSNSNQRNQRNQRKGRKHMSGHHQRYLAAATAAVIAGTLAVSTVAASASAARPRVAVAHAARAAQSTSLPKITVAMNGKQITVGGTLASGASRIVSTVTGEPQGDPIFVRLDPGVTLAQFFALLHSPASADPNNLDGIAAIVTDAQANQGRSVIQANLKAGQYVAFDTARGNPARWPFTTFKIATAAHPATLPAPAARIAAIEFGFTGPRILHSGDLVRFANHGFLVHMIVFATAASHRQARKVARFLKEGKQRKAQRHATGFGTFAGPLSHGALQQLVVRHPGWYVLACFMQTQDGRDHTRLGMERVIHVKK
jgi:hypothetical protein